MTRPSFKEKDGETNGFYETHKSCLWMSPLEKWRCQLGRKPGSVLISEIAVPCFSLGIACARVISVCTASNVCDTLFVTVCPLERDQCHWERACSGRASVVLAEDRRKQTDATYKARQCINHRHARSAEAVSWKHCTYFNILIKCMFYCINALWPLTLQSSELLR